MEAEKAKAAAVAVAQPAAAQVYSDFLERAEQLCHAIEPRKEGDPPDPSSEFYASALDPLI